MSLILYEYFAKGRVLPREDFNRFDDHFPLTREPRAHHREECGELRRSHVNSNAFNEFDTFRRTLRMSKETPWVFMECHGDKNFEL